MAILYSKNFVSDNTWTDIDHHGGNAALVPTGLHMPAYSTCDFLLTDPDPPNANRIDPNKGTIEMWFVPDWDGTTPGELHFFYTALNSTLRFDCMTMSSVAGMDYIRIEFYIDNVQYRVLGYPPIKSWLAGERHRLRVFWDFSLGAGSNYILFQVDEYFCNLSSTGLGAVSGLSLAEGALFYVGELPSSPTKCIASVIESLTIYDASLLAINPKDAYNCYDPWTPGSDANIVSLHSGDGFCTLWETHLTEAADCVVRGTGADVVFFRTDAFEFVYPGRVPATEDIVTSLSYQAAKGENVDLFFNVHTKIDLTNVGVSKTAFTGPGTIPTSAMDLRIVRKFNFGNSAGKPMYYPGPLMHDDRIELEELDPADHPELFWINSNSYPHQSCPVLDHVETDILADNARQFVLEVKVPSDAIAGVYSCTISLSADGDIDENLTLYLEVVPFSLRVPDKLFSINWAANNADVWYYGGCISKADWLSRVTATIQDMYDSGMNTFILYGGYLIPYQTQIKSLSTNQVVFSDSGLPNGLGGNLVLGTLASHKLFTDDDITITNTTNWNGNWTVTKIDANTFTLDGSTWAAGGDNSGNIASYYSDYYAFGKLVIDTAWDVGFRGTIFIGGPRAWYATLYAYCIAKGFTEVVFWGQDEMRITSDLGNYDFATSASWTWGAGWAHNAGTLKADHTPGNTAALEQTPTLGGTVIGYTYRVVYTISNCTAGTVTAGIGGVAGTARGADGTYGESITATTTGKLQFNPSTDFDGSIDTVLLNFHVPNYIANWEAAHDLGAKLCVNTGKGVPDALDGESYLQNTWGYPEGTYCPADFPIWGMHTDGTASTYIMTMINSGTATPDSSRKYTYWWQADPPDPRYNRKAFGNHLWLSDMDGAQPNFYMEGCSNCLNYLHSTNNHYMVLPTLEGFLPTYVWRACRAGINDYKWLDTWRYYYNRAGIGHPTEAQASYDVVGALMTKWKYQPAFMDSNQDPQLMGQFDVDRTTIIAETKTLWDLDPSRKRSVVNGVVTTLFKQFKKVGGVTQ